MTDPTRVHGGRPLVVRLDDADPDAVDRNLVGGKAAALARLTRSGHPVPDGVVVTTEAYRLAVHSGGPTTPDDDPDGDTAIDRWFDDLDLPEEVRSAIDRIAVGSRGTLAVRSSATGEDAVLAAFPGQYRSLLDVGPEELETALRRVWASLWHGAPRAYRCRSDRDDAPPAMAVIVMDMIPAEAGGVVFSRDPVGTADDVRIELVGGVGLLDHRPGFAAYEMTARPVFLAGFAIGAVSALRWLLLGGLIATATAAAMTAWYLHQLEPRSVVAVVVGFAAPGVAWLLLDLHDRVVRRAVFGIALAGIGTVVGFAVGTATWDGLFGATHPASTARTPAGSRVDWIWTGAVTADTATVVAAPAGSGAWDVIVDTGDSRPPARIPAMRSGRVVRAELTGLDAGTRYSLRVVGRGEPPSAGVDEATLRTVAEDDADVTVVFGSCMRTGSNGAVFDTIAALEPDLFVVAGDVHYGKIDSNDPDEFRDVLDVVLSRPGPSNLFRTTPIAYVWDDHDYGANNADASSPSRPAAMEA